MIRVLLAALSLVVFATTLQASGLDHLKAAKAAVEAGNADEAIHLFTQALAASDLSPDDQFAARKGRGTEYTAKSMIADAFQRRDDARRLRDNAVDDFAAALRIKADSELYSARGQALHLNGKYDQAVADFDAAFKLKDSTVNLMQRATSYRAKGDYDHAIADYTAVLGKDAKAAGLDGWEAYNERGYTYFLAARYADAAADFDKVLTMGSASRTGDVLWPYQAIWLHIARAKAGQNDTEELTRNAGKFDLKQWPGTMIAFFLGQVKADQLSPPSSHGSTMGRARDCNLSFFTGEHALVKGDNAEAARLFVRVREVCNIHTVHFLVAGVELKRLGK